MRALMRQDLACFPAGGGGGEEDASALTDQFDPNAGGGICLSMNSIQRGKEIEMSRHGAGGAFTRVWSRIAALFAAIGPCSSPWAFLELPPEDILLVDRMYSTTTSIM
ncbi:hypothetical protein [Nocardia xishanensis]|uniref:Uncharacterized protein n=1 Tax=Nocardia xishanensis TaxID=238964 RepID=A0ABW7X9Z3_9NOCA